MSARPEQLPLELPFRSARGMDDFLVSSSNREAVSLIDRWPDWPSWAALLHGPEGSGKSHLAEVWQQRSGARRFAARDLDDAGVAALEATGTLLVEDIDQGRADDRVLFHLLNVARERRGSILLTARLAPGEIDVALPDLRSRLRALPAIGIAAPDDALLGAVLVKLFADRQLQVDPQVVGYVLPRIERSMAALVGLVDSLDRAALARRRRVTRQLVFEVLKDAAAEIERGEPGSG